MNNGHNPVAIANYFIKLSKGEGLSLMQLLKLSYIAHGFKLALSDSPLANELVQAWKYGPVFASIYNAFKDKPLGNIKNLAEDFNKEEQCLKPISSSFETQEKEIIELVYKIYGTINGWNLSALTHKEGTPWHNEYNRKNGGKDFRGVTISNEDIKNHFKTDVLKKYIF